MFDYKNIDFVSGEFFKDVLQFGGDDVFQVDMPERTVHTKEENGKKYTVDLNIRSQITELFKHVPYETEGEDSESNEYRKAVLWRRSGPEPLFYEPADCSAWCRYHALSIPEQRDKEEPTNGSLTGNQAFIRIVTFLKICKLMERPEILDAVMDAAEHSRDGSFAQNRIVRIAAIACAQEEIVHYKTQPTVYTLAAVVKGPYALRIQLKKRTLEIHDPNAIDTAFDDMLSAQPELFGLKLDMEKYAPKKATEKITIRYKDKAATFPVKTEAGEIVLDAAALSRPLSAFSSVLKKSGEEYVLDIPDISASFPQRVGDTDINVTFDASALVSITDSLFKQFALLDDYFEGKIGTEDLMGPFRCSYASCREMFIDERVKSVCLSYSLKYIIDILFDSGRDPAGWAAKAELKENGKLKRMFVKHQYYGLNGEAVDGSYYSIYNCYATADTEFLIKVFPLRYDLSYSEAAAALAEE